VRENELKEYSPLLIDHRYPALKSIWGIPNSAKGIGGKRRYLIENCKTRYLLMIDDDLKFFHRPDMSKPKLQMLNSGNIGPMLIDYWHNLCHDYVHVGLSDRSGNNHYTDPLEPNYRIHGAYMYDLKKVLAAKPTLGRVPMMEDFDLTLQLLRKGIPNVVIFDYCWNHLGSGFPGGCSTYRTAELQAKAANQLAKFHPGFVRVVEKEVKTPGWWDGMKTRTDVRINWKKAFASSQCAG
jgi:hypothetical protein